MVDKKVLRKQVKDKLLAISKPIYEHHSYLIAQTLFQHPLWKSAETIGITISNFPEVDTYQIIRKAWEEEKKVVIPKCFPKERTMDFRLLKHFNELESVYYHLYEPIEAKTTIVEPDNIDLLIVPGLAFTKDGDRLGFGGGYYDRFLTKYSGDTLSIAFPEQIVNEIPVNAHDIRVKEIITSEGSIKASC